MHYEFRSNGQTKLELKATSPLEEALLNDLLGGDPTQVEVAREGDKVVVRKRQEKAANALQDADLSA